jgi:hypothetical protein
MNSITVYSYNPNTYEYCGTEPAFESPVPGLYMYPANTTTKQPYPTQTGYTQVLINGEWYVKEDHRGETWYLIGTDTPFVIDFLGEIDLTKYQQTPTLPPPKEPVVPAPAPEPAPPTTEELWILIRRKRTGLLSMSDYTQLPDTPLTPEQRTQWQTYRQQLRNIPQTYSTPQSVVWPTQPS